MGPAVTQIQQYSSYAITMQPGAAQRLLVMRDTATEPLLQLSHAATPQEADRLLREAVLTYHSLVVGLVDLLVAPQELEIALFPEPYNEASIGFWRTSGYHGGLLWHQDAGRFQIHT